jgi:spermidine/putrescine transport system permease protein
MLLARSIKISFFVTLVTLITTYPLAYYIAFYVKKNKMLWIVLMTLPFWTSYLLRVFSWKVILGHKGVINSALMASGMINEPLSFLIYSQTAVVLTLAHAWAAFAILPLYVSLDKIDKSLLEASYDLGNTKLETFWRVTFPLSLPGVIGAILIIFIPTVGDYVTPQLVGGTDGRMLSNMIQSLFGRANNFPLGAASAVLMLLSVSFVAVVVTYITRKVSLRMS